jgi:hypothetical protein
VPDGRDGIIDMAMLSGKEAFGHDLYDRQHVGIGDVDGQFVEPVKAPGIEGKCSKAYNNDASLEGSAAPGPRDEHGEAELREPEEGNGDAETGKKIENGEEWCPAMELQTPGGAECFYCECDKQDSL